ncbi:MAG TPA: hypothetical protein VEW93_14105 [Acidimicrobiales bacterium]|nr:hypothetical protein [Acidimicrobiales bacterium]
MGEAGAPGPTGEVRVQVVTGDPLVDRATSVYRQMLAQAGVPGAEEAQPPQSRPPGRTAFHVAIDASGTALGVVHTTLGALDELLMARWMDPDERLGGPICECPSIAVRPEAAGAGITELLFRSVYCFARRQGARSLATVLDPFSLTLFRDEYGILFRTLGPVTTELGFETVPVGEGLHELEDGLRRLRPEFLAFLTEPFSAAERARFGL